MVVRRRQNLALGNKRHALFFFLVYIAGATILTLEKWLFSTFLSNFHGAGGFIIILSATLLMATYVFCVMLVPATKLRTDVAADNVYYLGFLYTLTSLAIALSISEVDAILSNFGVAIVCVAVVVVVA